jgi:hypothetical protein
MCLADACFLRVDICLFFCFEPERLRAAPVLEVFAVITYPFVCLQRFARRATDVCGDLAQ